MANTNEYMRAWKRRDRVAHPEKYRAIWAEERARYREQRMEQMKAWRARNPDKVREANTKRECTGRKRVYPPRQPHEERLRKQRILGRLWSKRNPELKLLAQHRRRTRLFGLTEHYTLAEWRELVRLDGGACAYCGRTDLPLTRDHIRPLTRGGSDRISNIFPACDSCNKRKHTKTLYEFLVPMALAAEVA